ncbi:hypothetical protein [Leptospira mayottensis]|nr:hypothetical protein [Leptospira mayottensis]
MEQALKKKNAGTAGSLQLTSSAVFKETTALYATHPYCTISY